MHTNLIPLIHKERSETHKEKTQPMDNIDQGLVQPK